MRPYENSIPKEPVLSYGIGLVVFSGGSVFLYERGNFTSALVLCMLGLISAYILLGYRNKFQIFTDHDSLYLRERSLLFPLARPETRKIPFGDIRAFKIEHGPKSNYGPQVYGETVAVLATTAGEVRIFSRWLTHKAYRELLDLIRTRIPEKLG